MTGKTFYRKQVAQALRITFALVVTLCALNACAFRKPVPAGIVPEAREVTQADEEYGQEVLQTLTAAAPLSNDYRKNGRIRSIVSRLSDASGAVTHPWRVFVLEDPHMKNAAATRGNYIFIWDGMLDSVQNDDELAAVLAHEMSHVLAGHVFPTPGETSAGMLGTIGDLATRGALSSSGGAIGIAVDLAGTLVHSAVDALVLNPEKQRVELEADQIGLFLMADAGFTPEASERFWERNLKDPSFNGLGWANFLSDHPTSSTRLEQVKKLLPDAMDRYNRRNQKDSWAVPSDFHGKSDQSGSDSPAKPVPRGIQRWEIRAEILPVYSKPADDGEVVADLARGRQVEGKVVDSSWVELSRPFRGFVRSNDIELKSNQ